MKVSYVVSSIMMRLLSYRAGLRLERCNASFAITHKDVTDWEGTSIIMYPMLQAFERYVNLSVFSRNISL